MRHHNVLVCYPPPMSQPVSPLRPKRVSLSGHHLALLLSPQSSLLPRTTRRPKNYGAILSLPPGIWHHIPGLSFGVGSDLVRLVSRLMLTVPRKIKLQKSNFLL